MHLCTDVPLEDGSHVKGVGESRKKTNVCAGINLKDGETCEKQYANRRIALHHELVSRALLATSCLLVCKVVNQTNFS
jgi:hypothetical protein